LGDERLLIGSYIQVFMEVLEQQNPEEIEQIRSEIEVNLSELNR